MDDHATTTTSDPTAAATLAANPAVEQAVETLVRALEEAQATITGVRPPRPGETEEHRRWLDRAAAVRGRPGYYPYLGSGLGHGALVELADGSVKWDLINGIGVHMFGHGDLDLAATAVRAALGDTVMQGNLQFNADAVAFAELLVAEAGRTSELRHCFLTNSGAMANESALKICMQQREGRAPRVLAFDGCFMGRSVTMSQIGDNPGNRVDVPLSTLVDYLPFHDPEAPERSTEEALRRLRQAVARYPGQHACLVAELVQGEGGFNVAPRTFWEPLMTTCREHGIAVWADEVQTFGRTEAMFHFEQLGLGPLIDVATVGKMSQVCACLFTEDFNPKPGLLSGTFLGSTVALQVGRRALERLRDGGYYGPDGRNARLHRAYRAHAAALVERRPECFPPVVDPSGAAGPGDLFGGVGGMMRLTPFGGERKMVSAALRTMFEEGVIAFPCGHGPWHIRFLAPVGVLEPAHLDEIFPILERALARTAAEA